MPGRRHSTGGGPGPRAAGAMVACLLTAVAAGAAEPDGWVEDGPPAVDAEARSLFRALAATVSPASAGLAVVWGPEKMDGEGVPGPLLEFSTGAPGHWMSRDWRRRPMTPNGNSWRGELPLASITEPVVYRVRWGEGGRERISPVRVFRPTLAPEPVLAGPFSGFIEGFEEGIDGWEGAVPGVSGGFGWTTNALSGLRALRIEVPPGRASMTVGTVRIQGWMLAEHEPRAIRFAARTEGGEGKVGCRLHGNAGTDRVAVFPTRAEFGIGPEWRRLEVPIEAFSGLRPLEVDWMTIQFRAESGRALLVDDVELVLR